MEDQSHGLVMCIEFLQDLMIKYEIVAGVFSRNSKLSANFGTKYWGLKKIDVTQILEKWQIKSQKEKTELMLFL